MDLHPPPTLVVTYSLTYKTIVSGEKTVIAYQCGTPNPGVAGADLVVQVGFLCSVI